MWRSTNAPAENSRSIAMGGETSILFQADDMATPDCVLAKTGRTITKVTGLALMETLENTGNRLVFRENREAESGAASFGLGSCILQTSAAPAASGSLSGRGG